MKYKPCCSKRCCLGGCETQESGGCYCVCLLMDEKKMYERCLRGEQFEHNSGFIYVAGEIAYVPEEKKQYFLERLESINEKIKEYEIND